MREMKDSGITWLGEIPENWRLVKGKYMFTQRNTRGNSNELQLLSPTQNYGVIPQSLYEELSGMVAVKLNEKADLQTMKTIHKGDYCISLRSFQGGFEYSEYEGVVSPAYQVFYPTVRISDGFYKYLFKDKGFIEKMNSYTMTLRDGKNIAFTDFGNTYIPLPTVDEQQSIAAYLDKKCAEINSLAADIQTQIDTLEQYKRSVITEAVTKGLNPNAEMKDSGIAWVKKLPCSWSIIPAKHLFHNSDLRKQPNDKLLTASQKYGVITQKEYMEREQAQIVTATQGIENWKHVEPYDFIISLRSFQGGLEMSEITGCITWHYVILKASKKIFYRYYKWLFKSSMYINALQGTCNFIRDGQDLRFSNFSKVPLFEPPLDEQEKIANYLDAKVSEIDGIIEAKKEQLSVVEEYKKSLIFEYVTGKKEVV